ncbi:MAG TPA: transglycosylase family protein [Egibacteraceae bacterium]
MLPGHLVLGLLLPLLGFGVLNAEKTVTVTVDGRTRELRTSAATVGEALERAEVPVGPGDEVTPPETTPLRDGMTIRVTRGAALAAALAAPRRPHAQAASRLARAPAQVPVTLVADGQERQLTTTATTVGGLLHEQGISLGDQDRLSHDLTDPLTPGMRIVVQRVEVHRETVEVEVPFATEEREDASLPRGERVVVSEGRNGLIARTVEVVVVDGVEESRTVVAEETLRPAEPAVVAVGTADPQPQPEEPAPSEPAPAPAPPPEPAPEPAAPPAARSGDTSVWDRLAACESGGNWAANTGNGYYGGLQFSLEAWRSVGGSGYPHEHSRETQIAMGKRLQAAQGWGAWPSCAAKLGLD